MHARCLLEEVAVGRCTEDVLGDLGHRGSIERSEAYVFGAGVKQSVLGLQYGLDSLVWPEGQYPGHGQRGQPVRELAHSHRTARPSPLQVVQTDRQSILECGSLDQGLNVLQEPEGLLGRDL